MSEFQNRSRGALFVALAFLALGPEFAHSKIREKLDSLWAHDTLQGPAGTPRTTSLDTPELRTHLDAFRVAGPKGYHQRVQSKYSLEQAIRGRAGSFDGSERWLLREAADILNKGPEESHYDIISLLGEFRGSPGAELIVREVINGERSTQLRAIAMVSFGQINNGRRSMEARRYLERLADKDVYPVALNAAQALDTYYGDRGPLQRLESQPHDRFKTPQEAAQDFSSERYWMWDGAKAALEQFGARALTPLISEAQGMPANKRQEALLELACTIVTSTSRIDPDIVGEAVKGFERSHGYYWLKLLERMAEYKEARSAIQDAALSEQVDINIRWHAIDILGAKQFSHAIPHLKTLLESKNEFLASAAAAALAGHGDESGIALARSLLRKYGRHPPQDSRGEDKTWRTLLYGIRILGRFGDSQDIELIRPFTEAKGSRIYTRDADNAMRAIRLRSAGDEASQLIHLQRDFETTGSEWSLYQIRSRTQGEPFARYLLKVLQQPGLNESARRHGGVALLQSGWVDPEFCSSTPKDCHILKESYYAIKKREIQRQLKQLQDIKSLPAGSNDESKELKESLQFQLMMLEQVQDRK